MESKVAFYKIYSEPNTNAYLDFHLVVALDEGQVEHLRMELLEKVGLELNELIDEDNGGIFYRLRATKDVGMSRSKLLNIFFKLCEDVGWEPDPSF